MDSHSQKSKDLSLFCEALVDPVLITDSDLKIRHVNQAAKTFFSSHELNLKEITDLFSQHEGSLPTHLIFETIEDQGHFIGGPFHLTINEKRFWVEVNVTAAQSEDLGVQYLFHLKDVTNREEAYQELAESEQLFRLLIENSDDTTMRFDKELRHLYTNPVVTKQTGIPSKDFIGKTHEELGFPPHLCRIWETALKHVFEKQETHHIQFKLPNEIWMDWLLMPEFDEKGQVQTVITTARDITNHKTVERELRKSETRYRMLFNSFNDAIFLNPFVQGSPDQKFTEVNDVACKLLGYTREELLTMSTVDIEAKESIPLLYDLNMQLSEEKRVIFETQHVTKAGKSIPVEISAQIFAWNGHPMVLSVARDLSLRKNLEEMRRAMDGAIHIISRLVDTKDPYTAIHQRRVCELSLAIGRKLNLSQWQMDGLRVAGLLLDIGKLYVPMEILNKPGKINELETNIIRTHAQVGYEVLNEIEFPWPVAEMVRQHHERLDGSGYPRGLKGDEIRLEARILAVADVVETMSSHRPFRPAIGLKAALSEIEARKGELYDEKVVEACLNLFNEGEFKFVEQAMSENNKSE